MSDAEVVVDASALASVLIKPDTDDLRQRLASTVCHAPHLVDAEVGQVLRRKERMGQISAEVAATGLTALRQIVDERYPHGGRLADLAWQLRRTVSCHDGLDVAVATVVDVPLMTGDVKLSKAPSLPCQIYLIR
ncbi:type II toxin-antitoxin system VapC family toxin [Goodfellowiella coeruleoviolacea]|uniref:Nucleic acid-binding protein, contains PIN domain n=1 Tax=Goodfellowiella coeruleoviolacea TaxID=334858 RepID=A0AAE3GJU2_9PSEU|nr:PIN domain-containing protein [Goodfellowiella coeruleoviolacea]MCP2169525.1 putative nucleic acid-binding protein, contains PIN domain [Goodfellowiella coeruleoviolacea]